MTASEQIKALADLVKKAQAIIPDDVNAEAEAWHEEASRALANVDAE